MTTMSPYETLSTGVCPWLHAPLGKLEAAHGGGRMAHGWLLAGSKGTGKINLALAAARRLLEGSNRPVKSLGADEAAVAMAERHVPADHHPDLHWLFPESGRRTLAVDQIREATRALSLTSLAGQAKVLVLETADAMTTSAANALLKTLEEPSAKTYLLLISHQPGRLPATVRSRCQSLAVQRPPAADTVAWLGASKSEARAADWATLVVLAEGSPFRAIAFNDGDFINKNKYLQKQFKLISENRIDPQKVADEWLKGDIELALGWLTARLHAVIRMRLAPDTAAGDASLGAEESGDAWQRWTTRFLFEQLQNVELLLRRLGGGINVDLATRALLLEFESRGGRR